PYSYNVRAVDPDSDPLTYRLTQAPATMQIDPQSGLIRWWPTLADFGNHAVAVNVTDGRGGECSQSFTVSVSQDHGHPSPIIVIPPVTSASPAITHIDFESIPLHTLVRDQFDSIGVQIQGAGSDSGDVLGDTGFGIQPFGNSRTHVMDIGARDQPT